MASADETHGATYPMKAVVKLTGLSPDILRAWEKRYAVVEPLRTPGGTRRYRSSDIERLQRLKAAVDAGHRISDMAKLSSEELISRIEATPDSAASRIGEVMEALERLDAPAAERIMSLQIVALGPVRYAREYAVPLLREIGEAWQASRMSIASEHLSSGLLRSLLGSALRPTRASLQAPPIIFATPSGERHELGLLIAALTTLGAGGNPVYLGPDLPSQEIVAAVEQTGAAAVALSVACLDRASAGKQIEATREHVPDRIEIWVGGTNASEISLPDGVQIIESLDELERRVGLMSFRT
jgi:DNA-binding transcriptional MerR regulator